MLDKITEYIIEIGINPEDVDVNWHYEYETPYIARFKDRDNYRYKLLNNFIMELILMHKLDKAVKAKFGHGGWDILNKLFNFKNYYIKTKIKRYMRVLDTYLKEIDRELDIVERRKSPEEIREQMINSGYLKKD